MKLKSYLFQFADRGWSKYLRYCRAGGRNQLKNGIADWLSHSPPARYHLVAIDSCTGGRDTLRFERFAYDIQTGQVILRVT